MQPFKHTVFSLESPGMWHLVSWWLVIDILKDTATFICMVVQEDYHCYTVDGGKKVLWNGGNLLPVDMAYPSRLSFINYVMKASNHASCMHSVINYYNLMVLQAQSYSGLECMVVVSYMRLVCHCQCVPTCWLPTDG